MICPNLLIILHLRQSSIVGDRYSGWMKKDVTVNKQMTIFKQLIKMR